MTGPGLQREARGFLKSTAKRFTLCKSQRRCPSCSPGTRHFDVGIDTRTGVNDLDYQVPFRFNGKISNVTFNLGPTQLTATEEMRVREATARARDLSDQPRWRLPWRYRNCHRLPAMGARTTHDRERNVNRSIG